MGAVEDTNLQCTVAAKLLRENEYLYPASLSLWEVGNVIEYARVLQDKLTQATGDIANMRDAEERHRRDLAAAKKTAKNRLRTIDDLRKSLEERAKDIRRLGDALKELNAERNGSANAELDRLRAQLSAIRKALA